MKKNSKKTKILVALTLTIFCLSFGLTCYANVGVDTAYTGASEWFGMNLTSVTVDYQNLPSGDSNITWQERLDYPNEMTYTHAYSPVPLLYSAGQEYSNSVENISLLAYNYDLLYEFSIFDSVTYSQHNQSWRYSTGLDIHSDSIWSTNVTFSFAPFYFNSATMEQNDFLHIAPIRIQRTMTEMMVRYEYDIISLQWYPTVGEWEQSDVTHIGEWDVINANEANSATPICFMPPSLVSYTNGNSNREKRAVVSNLQVTILDMQATQDEFSYSPNTCYYELCDSYGHQDMIKLDYTDGGTNILETMETAGFFSTSTTSNGETPGMFDWMIDSLDAFVSLEVAPGFSLGSILGVLLGLGLLMLLLKLVAGG